jgi:hypothetical protein
MKKNILLFVTSLLIFGNANSTELRCENTEFIADANTNKPIKNRPNTVSAVTLLGNNRLEFNNRAPFVALGGPRETAAGTEMIFREHGSQPAAVAKMIVPRGNSKIQITLISGDESMVWRYFCN